MQFFMKEKLISIHGIYHIYDMEGSECYYVKSKAISITRKTYLYDMQDSEIAFIHAKPISMHAVHYITMANGEETEVETKKLIQVHMNLNVPGFGWHLEGKIMAHDFSILDEQNHTIATVHRKWISLGEGFEINVENDSQGEKVLAVMIVLEQILADMENSDTAAVNAANSANSQ